jgi:hypothetical protein
MTSSAVHSWCSGRNHTGNGCEHGLAVRATCVALWLMPHSQFSQASRPASLSIGGSHIFDRLVGSESSLWDGAADFLFERVHHDVDVVAEHGVETHAERCL